MEKKKETVQNREGMRGQIKIWKMDRIREAREEKGIIKEEKEKALMQGREGKGKDAGQRRKKGMIYKRKEKQ